MSKAELLNRRGVLIIYLNECVRIEDWHGVQDAASDIREVDAMLSVLEKARECREGHPPVPTIATSWWDVLQQHRQAHDECSDDG